jgi:ligand-binding sensor domain-containing protein
MISGGGAIYSLQIVDDGSVCWSGSKGFGKLEFDDQGLQQIKILSAPEISNVYQALVVGKKIFFVTEDKLFQTDEEFGVPTKIEASNYTGAFTSIIELYGSIYLNTQRGGVYRVENSKLVQASLGFPSLDEIVFATRFDHSYLIGLNNNKVYLVDEDLKITEVVLEDQQYADASVVISGRWINRDLIVLGTLRGGMIYVDPGTGKTREIINYATGLPDNEVYALMSDHSQSIWAAHEYGFTRVSPYVPFRSFSHYPGLQGNLLCAISAGDKVYVGTSLGLFKLDKEEIYEEISYFVEVKKSTTDQKVSVRPTPEKPEIESKRRGLLHFLRRNRNKRVTQGVIIPEENGPPEDSGSGNSSGQPAGRASYDFVKKTDTVLRSASFLYKKVKGIDAKVTALIAVNGTVIAAGLAGTYEVEDLAASPIQNEPARFVFASNDHQLLFISTYKNEIRTLQRFGNAWIASELLRNLDDQINSIFQGEDGEFWFCGVNRVYRLKISGNKIDNLQMIEFPNPNFDEFVGMYWKDKITMATSVGFFQYDESQNEFLQIDSLGEPSEYYADDSNIWYRDTHSWNLLGKNASMENLQLLNLYGDLRFIATADRAESLWLITGNNELYRFSSEKLAPMEAGYPLLLKSIRNSNRKVSRKGTIQFDQDKSSVTFEVVQPDYMAPQAIEYRYQLMGLEKSWSEWSVSYNIIDFPYLPPGDYSLQVQSRDIFGNIGDLLPISFEVLAPYWKRPWFYALEFVLFATLVVLSLRLSTRYRVVSRLLSLLTIILLLQFIQTVTGEVFETRASPVMDFFVQVLVALLILPFEEYLRNLLLGSVDDNSVLHRLILPRRNLRPPENPREH